MEQAHTNKTIRLGYAAGVFAVAVVAVWDLLWCLPYIPSALSETFAILTTLRGPLLTVTALVLAVVLFLNRHGPFESLDRIFALFFLVEIIGYLMAGFMLLFLFPAHPDAPRFFTPARELILYLNMSLCVCFLGGVIVGFFGHRTWVRAILLIFLVIKGMMLDWPTQPNNPQYSRKTVLLGDNEAGASLSIRAQTTKTRRHNYS